MSKQDSSPSNTANKNRKQPLLWLLAGLVVAGIAYVAISYFQTPPPLVAGVATPAPQLVDTLTALKKAVPQPVVKVALPKVEPPKKEKVVKKPKPQAPGEEVVVIADEPAEPEGGYETFYKYIKLNLKYPEEARHQKAEGKVWLEFVVKKDGSLAKVKVQKGIGFGCDEEAIRVIRAGSSWKPAKNKGTPVLQKVSMPIVFRLN